MEPHSQIAEPDCRCLGCELLRSEAHWEAAEREGRIYSQRLGLAIRTEREAAGKSLRSVARRLDMAPTYLSSIEIGKLTLPKRALIARIRAAIKTAANKNKKIQTQDPLIVLSELMAEHLYQMPEDMRLDEIKDWWSKGLPAMNTCKSQFQAEARIQGFLEAALLKDEAAENLQEIQAGSDEREDQQELAFNLLLRLGQKFNQR